MSRRFRDPFYSDSFFFEPSYVVKPALNIDAIKAVINKNRSRTWCRKDQLDHFEPGRETWEFAHGDLVRHKNQSQSTVGIIGNSEWKTDHEGNRYEIFDVLWGDNGPGPFVDIADIGPESRKLRFKWTAEPAPKFDFTKIKLFDE